jgi:hypothetical protein
MLGQAAGAAATAAHAELLRADHEPPLNKTKHFSWPRVSPTRVFAVVVAVLILISGSYLLISHRPMLLPPSADPSGKPSGAGTRITSSGSTSATAPAMQTVPEGPLGRASTVASSVGQITLNWNGANSVSWKVLDADRKTALRNSGIRAKGSESQDLPPGDYVVTLNATGFQPIPVSVRNGQASTVTP